MLRVAFLRTALIRAVEGRKTMQSYRAASCGDNLPARLVSFHNWLCKLSEQEGFCWASTPYLAMKQGVSERTVYRWLSRLRGRGFISGEVDLGLERRITPEKCVIPLPKKRSRVAQSPKFCFGNVRGGVRGSVRGGVRGPLGIDASDACTHKTTTHNTNKKNSLNPRVPSSNSVPLPSSGSLASGISKNELPPADSQRLVQTLVTHGVASAKAVALVDSIEEKVIVEQVEALPHRKANNPSAVLVSSIENNWSLPSALTEEKKRRFEQEKKTQERLLRAALEQKRVEGRSGALATFSGLPDAQKAHWRELARRQIEQEKPAFVKMSEGRAVLGEIIEQRAAQLSTAAAITTRRELLPNSPTVREQVGRGSGRAQNMVFQSPPGA